MPRVTADYGIDLGTTNSSIAVLEGNEPEVIENNEGAKYTPSAVWVDARGALHVGRTAKQRIEARPGDAHCEFKLMMGTSHEYRFAEAGRTMRPEDLSAEVLKSLRADVLTRRGEEVDAAVITVPAAFELPQCEATKRAAQLAGLSFSPLVQEPVAAALAYGFQSESDRVFWLVFDIGGGTFDAAIVNVRDGAIHVVNHGGDNHLGGKLIDWDIVHQLLVPVLKRDYAFAGLDHKDERCRSVFAKLKQHAEEAKIRLSRDETAMIFIEPLGQDERGNWVNFECELRRGDVERLVAPYVERALSICDRVLKEKNLGPGDVERMVLVGGPTLTPMLREMLTARLGIPLEFSVDPLTVVAQGAAIFAGTQRLPESYISQPVKAGQYVVQLEYKPIDSDQEPLLGGKVTSPEGSSLEGFAIEFIESKSEWRSGKISLTADGSFVATLKAEKGRPNEFLIQLTDAQGALCETVPDRVAYRVGISVEQPPLINSVGVALVGNRVHVFVNKGTPLPARRRVVLRSAVPVRSGQSEALLKIPVVEGENPRADRTRLIGELLIQGAHVRRDVPIGSEVEVTIDVDESRLVRTMAYIPILDEEFEKVIDLHKPDADPHQLAREHEQELARLSDVQKKAREQNDQRALEALARIDREQMVRDVETALAGMGSEPDAAQKSQNRLLDLKVAIDEAEEALAWPELVAKAEKEISDARQLVNEHGGAEERRRLTALESETRAARAAHDTDLLTRKVDELTSLQVQILVEQPGFWVGYLQYLAERQSMMTNPALAQQLLSQGTRAINSNDVEGLKSAVRQLVELLPPDEQAKVRRGLDSGVTL